MTRVRLIQFGVVTVAAIAISAAKPGPTPAVRDCDANSPHAKAFIALANSVIPHMDDEWSKDRLGVSKPPKSVTLVTQAVTCNAVLAAHNKSVGGKYAAYRVSTAAIAQAGTSYLVYIPAGAPSEEMVFIYDSTLRFRGALP